MAERDGEQSQQPTQRRRQQAREQGNVVKSQDLASAIVFLGALGGLYYFGGKATQQIWLLTQSALNNELPVDANVDAAVSTWHMALGSLTWSVGPLLAIFVGVAIVANVVQTGWLFLPTKASFDVERVSPWRGVGRVFSIVNSAKLGLSLLKIVVIASIVYWQVRSRSGSLFGLVGSDMFAIVSFTTQWFFELGWQIGCGLLVVAGLDYGFQYWKHEQELRMTPQEVLEELRSVEADPQVSSRRRKMHRQLTTIPNELNDVDIVVTSPAGWIGVRFDEATMATPLIAAVEIGPRAVQSQLSTMSFNERVVTAATLTSRELARMRIGDEIPSHLYELVARVYSSTTNNVDV